MTDWVSMQLFKDLDERVKRLEKLCEGFLRHTHAEGRFRYFETGEVTGEEAVRRSIESQEAERDG